MTTLQDYYSLVSKMRQEISGHLPSIEWLVSQKRQDRGTGRSHVLATAFLKAACTTPGSPVMVFDHQTTNSRELMTQMIRTIAPSVQIWGNGQIDPQPAFASDPGHPDNWRLVSSLREDFVSLCRACLSHGVSVDWMLGTVKQTIVESVMRS